LLAWYDTHPDEQKPPELIFKDIVFLREQMTNRSAYSRAYVEARDAYLDEPAVARGPTTGPSSQPIGESTGVVPMPPPPIVFYSEPAYEPSYVPLYEPAYVPFYSRGVAPGYYYRPLRFGYTSFSHHVWPWYRSYSAHAFAGSKRFGPRFDRFPHSFGHAHRSPVVVPPRRFRSGGAILRPGGSVGGDCGGRYHDHRQAPRTGVVAPGARRDPSFVGPTAPPARRAQPAPSAAPGPRSSSPPRGGNSGGRSGAGGNNGGGGNGGAGGRNR
jgi:hypothetical protein